MSQDCQICNSSLVRVKKCKDCGIMFCESCGSMSNGRCKSCNRQHVNRRREVYENIYVEDIEDVFIHRSLR